MHQQPGSVQLSTHLLFVFFLISAALLSCHQPETQQAGPAYSGKPLFPDTVQIKYARGFQLEYHPNYKLLQVFTSSGKGQDTTRYLLVQRGTPAPGGYPYAQQIWIPLRSMIGTSSMHVALADFADCSGLLTGLEDLRYVFSPAVRERIRKGLIKGVGVDGNLDNEQVLALHPDLVMVTKNPGVQSERYGVLQEAGIPVLANAEWMETTPLGQAEWVKLMAALVNKEAAVNRAFDSVETAYQHLAQQGRGAAGKPAVITGLAYKGTWFVPRGESFMAQFLRDAGAAYPWAATKGSGNLALSFESVAPQGLQADYWINTSDAVSKTEIADRDRRYADFKPFKNNTIYNNNNQVNDQGSNDYWESAAFHPQIILADLIRIFHPDLLPTHQLVYYKQIK
ncbi:MAG: ABC transporter substrate-binding protein [Williamsia sp.]|nr:ABC transporter substrate-binding protein [Williamsia sp.]